MKVHQKIQGHKQTLLMLAGTAVAFGAFASTAAAASGVAAAIPNRVLPPVIGGPYGRVHVQPIVLRGERIPEGLMVVDTAGVASRHGVRVRVDESFHAVNAKGYRVGGRTPDS
jgi:hypothetical protein